MCNKYHSTKFNSDTKTTNIFSLKCEVVLEAIKQVFQIRKNSYY